MLSAIAESAAVSFWASCCQREINSWNAFDAAPFHAPAKGSIWLSRERSSPLMSSLVCRICEAAFCRTAGSVSKLDIVTVPVVTVESCLCAARCGRAFPNPVVVLAIHRLRREPPRDAPVAKPAELCHLPLHATGTDVTTG